MINVKKPIKTPGSTQPMSKATKASLTAIAESLKGKELFLDSVVRARETLGKVKCLPKNQL